MRAARFLKLSASSFPLVEATLWPASSRTPRRAPARVALEARAVPHHREVLALGAGFALVTFRLCREPLIRDLVARVRRGGSQHFRRGFGFQRRRPLREPTAERRDVGAALHGFAA